jgi:ketosteroid isomerase-like protein
MIALPAALAAALEQHRDAFAQCNADAIADLCTKDCMVLTQGSPPIHGKDAVRRLYRSVYAAGRLAYEQTLLRAEISATLAILTLEIDLQVRQPATAQYNGLALHATDLDSVHTVESAGMLHLLSLFVWRKEEGGWKLAQRISMAK